MKHGLKYLSGYLLLGALVVGYWFFLTYIDKVFNDWRELLGLICYPVVATWLLILWQTKVVKVW